MNLKQEVRAAWVAQEIKRLWPGAAQRRPKAEAKPKRAFKTERPPRTAAQQPKEQSSRAGAAQPAQPAQPPGDTRPPAG
jgi:hypothetical protein